jgi:tetratricopeptide (TPR) repeat protein
MYDDALAAFQKAVNLSGGNPEPLAAVGYVHALKGQPSKAREILADLKRLSQRRYVSSYDMAVLYLGLGEKKQALEWLEKAYGERYALLIYLGVEPTFDSLRAEPRFQGLLRRIGLPL